MNRKKLLGLLFVLFMVQILVGQKNYFSSSVNAGITVIGTSNINRAIWNFDSDIDKVIGKPHLSAVPLSAFSVFACWGHTFYHKKKSQIAFETGIGYDNSSIHVRWTGEYTIQGQSGSYPYILDISRQNHQFLIPFTIHYSYSNYIFFLGPVFHFPIYKYGSMIYTQNTQIIYDYPHDSDVSGFRTKPYDFRFSFYGGFGYTFKVLKKMSITPMFTYSLGAYNFETFGLGYVRNRAGAMGNQFSIGLKFDVI